MSNALALAQPASFESVPSHRAQLVLPEGAVRASLDFVRATRKGSHFVLFVENDMDAPLLGCAYARSKGAPPLIAPLESFWISGNTRMEYQLTVPRRFQLRFNHLSVRLRNNVSEYEVDCAVPPRQNKLLYWSALLLVCAFAAAALAFSFTRPRHILQIVDVPSPRRVVVVHGPSVAALSLDQTVAQAGTPLIARYSVRAAAGELRAIDVNGFVWASAPLSRSGTSTLQLPRFVHDKELRVELLASQNGQRTNSSIGIYVRGAGTGKPKSAATGRNTSTGPVQVLTPHPAPGSDLILRVNRHPPDLRIALTTDTGEPLGTESIDPSVAELTVHLPQGIAGNVVLVTSYDTGSSAQALVERLPLSAQ